ncbi:hypothetical protein, partial [uncultured Duncaniella sp.]|uniref:hypothetical protein n=2 Tax=uncultured Duncaniella sp. TaxID=2768039 RepID=UPI0025B6FB96
IVTIFALCFHGIRFKVKEQKGCRDDSPLFFSFFIAVSPIVRRSVSLSLCLVVVSGKIFQKMKCP